MTTTHILFSEAVASLRLNLCTVPDRDLRERLVAQFDHIRELLGDTEVKTSLQWEEEVKSLKNDVLCAEGDHEDAAKKVDKHLTILAHLQETIGMAICLAVKPEHRARFHGDFDIVEDLIADQLSLDGALKIIAKMTEANHVA